VGTCRRGVLVTETAPSDVVVVGRVHQPTGGSCSISGGLKGDVAEGTTCQTI
jgi:hypothetical protein